MSFDQLMGELNPQYVGTKFNLAEKSVIKVVANLLGKTDYEVLVELKKVGDLGKLVAEYQLSQDSHLSIMEVYDYLKKLDKEKLDSHIYLNYLALLYGGQMIKSKIPGRGLLYDFDDQKDCIASIRAIQKDEWVEEVNKGYGFIIQILDELQATSRQDS